MNQGVLQIDLVSYRAVSPAPGVGVIIRFAIWEFVVTGAVGGVKKMIGWGRMKRAPRSIKDAAPGAGGSWQPTADAVSGRVGDKVPINAKTAVGRADRRNAV